MKLWRQRSRILQLLSHACQRFVFCSHNLIKFPIRNRSKIIHSEFDKSLITKPSSVVLTWLGKASAVVDKTVEQSGWTFSSIKLSPTQINSETFNVYSKNIKNPFKWSNFHRGLYKAKSRNLSKLLRLISVSLPTDKRNFNETQIKLPH